MVEKAQEKVAGLQTLTVELGRQLEEEREERENLVATWDQEMADLQAQVSSRHREHTVSVCRTLQVVVELHQLHSLQRLKCQPFSPQSVSLIERFFSIVSFIRSVHCQRFHCIVSCQLYLYLTSFPLCSNELTNDRSMLCVVYNPGYGVCVWYRCHRGRPS